jgi:hypothetical protein
MIIILILIFLFLLKFKSEDFIDSNIYKDKFLDIIEILNSNQELKIKHTLNIISGNNKKMLKVNQGFVDFSGLYNNQNTNFKIIKLKNKNTINILINENSYLDYDENLNKIGITSEKSKNTIFILEDILNKYNELDSNLYRFTSKLRFNNLYLGHNGFSNIPEYLLFDFKISI